MRHAIDAHSEKRYRPRHYMLLPIQCQLSRLDTSSVGWMVDLSSIGVGVISTITLRVGDDLTVTLPKETGPEMTLAATVRWREGLCLGVEFTPTPSTSPLTSLKFLYHLSGRLQLAS